MEVLLVNRKQHKLLQNYLHKVKNLIKYMYETMLVMQPIMYIYTQEGMHVSQIQLTWKKHGANTMAHGIFYVCHNTCIDEQVKCIKQMFDVMSLKNWQILLFYNSYHDNQINIVPCNYYSASL